MTVLVLIAVAPGLRGYVTRWLIELAASLPAPLSRRVRDHLWLTVEQRVGEGRRCSSTASATSKAGPLVPPEQTAGVPSTSTDSSWSSDRPGNIPGQQVFSPPTRGWSAHRPRPRVHYRRAPRLRGGGPRAAVSASLLVRFSPPTRGWSHDLPGRRPERPGSPRLRGGGPWGRNGVVGQTKFSPPTRGWSPRLLDLRGDERVLPAYAGVVRTARSATRRRPRFSPPTRGWSRVDGAAVVGAVGSPRLRGGGPPYNTVRGMSPLFSPPTRGWSRTAREVLALRVVLPAYAGVVRRRSWHHDLRLPFSPPTRGWSPHRVIGPEPVGVLPAYAGVVPQAPTPNQAACRSPRLRGGGPVTGEAIRLWHMFSPPTRGWSLHPAQRRRCGAVLPAYAGVVPRAGTRCPQGSRSPRLRGGGPQPNARTRA